MANNLKHLSQKALIQATDANDEWNQETAKHLAHCPECLQEVHQLAGLLDEIQSIAYWGVAEPNHEMQRRFGERLHAFAIHERRKEKFVRHLIIAGAAAVALIAILLPFARLDQRIAVPYLEARSMPNPTVTPGDVRSVQLSEVCQMDDTDKDPPVTATVRQAIFRSYGLPDTSDDDAYQVDYLISPQLGGTADVKNLWPQPYRTAEWNAYAKDELEDRLHEMVCTREITLGEAQQAIRSDWISAYQRYFHRTPLQDKAQVMAEKNSQRIRAEPLGLHPLPSKIVAIRQPQRKYPLPSESCHALFRYGELFL